MLIIDSIYFAVLFIAFITSTFDWKNQRMEDRILSSLLMLTFISESIAEILAVVYQNNMVVFHFFNPIQFLLISLYYNYTIILFKKYNLGVYIGLFGILVSIMNSLFLQKTSEFNNYFLLLEGLFIIGMTLQFFLQIVRMDKLILFKNKHLWISVVFLFFWSVTYTYWALTNAISLKTAISSIDIFYILFTVNIITYGGFATIFILKKKNVLHNEY